MPQCGPGHEPVREPEPVRAWAHGWGPRREPDPGQARGWERQDGQQDGRQHAQARARTHGPKRYGLNCGESYARGPRHGQERGQAGGDGRGFGISWAESGACGRPYPRGRGYSVARTPVTKYSVSPKHEVGIHLCWS